MTERGKKKKTQHKQLAPTRSSSRLLQVGPVNYKEVDLSSYGEVSEGTAVESELGFGTVKLEGEARRQELLLQQVWSPRTTRDNIDSVGIQVSRLAEENSELNG